MITGRIKIQVAVFVVIALVGTAYLSARYVGLNLFGSGYEVTVSLPDSGGSFVNGEVTYRGVPVGRVKALRATGSGAEAVLRIDRNAPAIPASARVSVRNRSAIGEQYFNLEADSGQGPHLTAGSRLAATAADLPPDIDRLLRTSRDFVGSVPADALTTVIDESYEAARGSGEQLGRLVETSQQFAKTADANYLVTAGLIENSSIVLSTQQESADSIRAFSRDLNVLASTLADSDKDLRSLIGNTPEASTELTRFFDQVGAPLGTVMANLVSTAQVFGLNASGMEDAMIRLPEALSIGFANSGSQGMRMGLAQTYFDPLPCTAGYAGTQLRPGLETSAGKPFNLDAGCSGGSGNVRGPSSAPKKGSANRTSPTLPRVTGVDTLDDLLGGGR